MLYRPCAGLEFGWAGALVWTPGRSRSWAAGPSRIDGSRPASANCSPTWVNESGAHSRRHTRTGPPPRPPTGSSATPGSTRGIILAGYFAATTARFAANPGTALVWHDAIEFSFTRDAPEAIGRLSF